MWRKLVLALIVVPLGFVLVTLAVVNRTETTLILDPFGGSEGGYALQGPFFLFLLGAFALGLVVGGTATWFRQGRWRRTAREGLARPANCAFRPTGSNRSLRALGS